MINFSAIKAISIPEGIVKKIMSGGRVLWELASGTLVEYTGAYNLLSGEIDGVVHNIYQLTTSGTLTLSGGSGAKVWLCGGGAGGYGGGGGGGYVTSGEIAGDGSYVVTIGSGGASGVNGSVTQLGNLSANGGSTGTNGEKASAMFHGGAGGSGGGGMFYRSNNYITPKRGGEGAGVSTYPFGLDSLEAHCAGGGGGTTVANANGAGGGSNGKNGLGGYDDQTGYISAEKGGGCGCYLDMTNANATFYGSGGGGGGDTDGSGYQGAVYIAVPA